MLHRGILVRFHYLHDGAIDHCTTLILNLVHDLLLLCRFSYISFFGCTDRNKFHKDVGTGPLEIYFYHFGGRIKSRFIYLFFQKFGARLTHHYQARIKFIFGNLSFFADFLIGPLLLLIEQGQDRGLEHVYDQLVAFPLAESRSHFDSSELA